MKIQSYLEGTDIINRGEKCKQLMFVVNGVMELSVDDQVGDNCVLEELK